MLNDYMIILIVNIVSFFILQFFYNRTRIVAAQLIASFGTIFLNLMGLEYLIAGLVGVLAGLFVLHPIKFTP